MLRFSILSWAAGLILLGTACGRLSTTGTVEQTQPRGKYLVENVAMCADCHTARNQAGALDQTQWLQGSVLDFQPAHALPNWAGKAPGIAGLPKLGDAAVIRLL
jgi:mono/diheme cytochrome c family protein